MRRIIYLLLLLFASQPGFGQLSKIYTDATEAFQKDYVSSHEVVKGKDKKYFRFFPADQNFAVECSFEKIRDSIGFNMKTSAGTTQHYFRYGRLRFILSGKACVLYIYQSETLMKTVKYKDYLFIPFTDNTTGDETYGSGRYLDLTIQDTRQSKPILDFNKSYNPYCAYASGYHCPIPPKENHLPVAVKAGEMNFGKKH